MAVKRPGGRAYARAKDAVKKTLARIGRRKSAGCKGG
jgi:hypothetical protein